MLTLKADPDRVRQWIPVVMLIAMGIVILPVAVWEFVARRGVDYGVDAAITAWVGAILAGPVGIKFVRKNGNGTNGTGGTA